MTDDGTGREESDMTGVTERRYTYITPRNTIPRGLPEKIEEKYLDLKTGNKITLQSQQLHYDGHGNLCRQEFFDANGAYVYALQWDYNEHGKVVRELDPLGRESIKEYDLNDNLISETHLRH